MPGLACHSCRLTIDSPVFVSLITSLVILLQEELLKERSKHQKYTTKRNEEFKVLLQEVSQILS